MITAGTVKESIINRRQLSTVAAQHGLHVVGIVPPAYPAARSLFDRWIAEGKHGEMAFLERHREGAIGPATDSPRMSVGRCLLYVLSALPVLPSNLLPSRKWLRMLDSRTTTKVLRRKVEAVFQTLSCLHDDYRVTVDSAPVLERALAAQGQSGFHRQEHPLD
jgi:epoxyqueuosine reductase